MNPVIPFIVSLSLLIACPSVAIRVGPIRHRATHLPSNEFSSISRQIQTCASDSDCPGHQQCFSICLELGGCSCDDPCSSGNICVESVSDARNLQTCIPEVSVEGTSSLLRPIECSGGSSNGEPAGEPTDEAVCIDSDMLKSFASHELVFQKHILARVLCDSAGSCATKGHIVNYKGTGIMMINYCNIVGCKEKVMEVNSPRYRRGLKVISKSEDMQFTAFAARYETRTEEAVLAAAVRFGF